MSKKQGYISLIEAAKYMGEMTPNYLRELARAGAIPAVKFSESAKAQWFFKEKDLDNWAQENTRRLRANFGKPKSE